MDKTHVTINVAGQELRLSADDSEAYIRKIAGYVNVRWMRYSVLIPTLARRTAS